MKASLYNTEHAPAGVPCIFGNNENLNDFEELQRKAERRISELNAAHEPMQVYMGSNQVFMVAVLNACEVLRIKLTVFLYNYNVKSWVEWKIQQCFNK